MGAGACGPAYGPKRTEAWGGLRHGPTLPCRIRPARAHVELGAFGLMTRFGPALTPEPLGLFPPRDWL